MDLQNVQTSRVVWGWNIDQPVEPSRTENRWINNVWTICRANHYNVDEGLNTVHLGQQLANHPLRDTAVAEAHSSARNHGVQFVEEDDRRRGRPTLPEYLSDGLLRFAHPLAEELGSLDRDEVRLTLRRHCTSKHSLTTSGRPEQENTLRWSNAYALEDFRLLQRPLDRLL